MKATKKQGERVYPEAGPTIGLLTEILDWGTQTDSYGSRRKVELIWELPDQMHEFEDGLKPLRVDRKFALTISKKAGLKECIEGMTGVEIEDDELELEQYLGTACQLQLALEKDGDYTNVVIKSYMGLSSSDRKRKFKPFGELKILDLDNFDAEVFASLPDWKQDNIKKSPECKEALANVPAPKTQAKSAPAAAGKAKASDLFTKGKKK